jgi:archaemetzincin
MRIGLLRIGNPDEALVQHTAAGLRDRFRFPVIVLPGVFDPSHAFHVERQQYHSSELLQQMHALVGQGYSRLLGITDRDLFIPILTFVFGEAQIDGLCALISTHRLRQEFYGLPPDGELLRARTLKEGVHELGHTFGLMHCEDYECVMASSHSVEWIDLKTAELCQTCREQMLAIK